MVREAEEADRLTYLKSGETITADDGSIASQHGQPLETFVLTYSTSDAATVVADNRKRTSSRSGRPQAAWSSWRRTSGRSKRS